MQKGDVLVSMIQLPRNIYIFKLYHKPVSLWQNPKQNSIWLKYSFFQDRSSFCIFCIYVIILLAILHMGLDP